MGKINLLSFAVANLIAAGEVVDRPASVVKELLENAIDAGADRITVEIQRGGTTFMRVADNGCGMEKEDLAVSIRRHATSKIKDAEDLDSIMTLGFRGEALAAIAAVSDLRIITRTKDAPFGVMLQAHGGEVESITEQGCPVGTTVIVENLFCNVPARRKFLKKDVSESIAVSTYVEKIALSRPDIAIRLIADGNVKLDTAGDGNLKSAMYAIFGRDFVSRMIAVKGGNDTVCVSGFIGRSDNVRPKRNYENFFINGRYVGCRTAAAALEQAYTSFIPPEKFPCCVLNIEIDPAAVDVNVHPAKLEVKFSNEKPVFDAVYYAVRTALEENVERPELRLKTTVPDAARAFAPVEEAREALSARQLSITAAPPAAATTPAPAFARMSAAEYRTNHGGKAASPIGHHNEGKTAGWQIPLPAAEPPKAPAPREETASGIISASGGEISTKAAAPAEKVCIPQAEVQAPLAQSEASPKEESAPTDRAPLLPAYRIVGEAFHSFVIVECEDRLLLIDKHAAHERVLFEELKKKMKQREDASQILLLPLTLTLTSGEGEVLLAFLEEIEAVGFGLTVTGNKAEVREIPEGLSPTEATELLLTLADQLQEGTGSAALSRDILFEKALYQGACKAAIKAGREYPPEYIEWLCRRLMALPDITVCPHGRPVAMVLTRATLHRQFGRT